MKPPKTKERSLFSYVVEDLIPDELINAVTPTNRHPDPDKVTKPTTPHQQMSKQLPGTLQCPAYIELLLQYYYSPSAPPRPDAPTTVRGTQYLLKNELIAPREREGAVGEGDMQSQYRATEKGEAMIEMLCQLPFPRRVYVDHNGKAIERE